MKRLILLAFLLVAGYSSFAQDIITKKDGTDIKAKISEVGTTEVKYKNFSNLDGPVYTISKSDILMITYENGERDIFNTESKSNTSIPEGIMTLDRWTGRLSINGMNIDKKSTHLYLSPEADAMYKSGDSLSSVGDVLMAAGAGGAAGYFAASLATGNTEGGGAIYGICAGLIVIGLPLHIVGVNKINNAIADYNSKHGFAHSTPEVSIGAQQYGMGIALKF